MKRENNKITDKKRMMGKRTSDYPIRNYQLIIISLFLIISIGILNINLVIAPNHQNTQTTGQQTQTNQQSQIWPAFNVCCEKTKNGAWCQNTKEDQCNTGFRKTPTSCDATSYCKLGCCVDSEEGLCMQNTPQKVCEISKGTWIDDEKCQVPQCNLGCCIIGDQASFVTLTRCKRLSSLYGLQTDFRNNINNEATCILTAFSSERGACVFESEGSKTCRMATRADCLKTSGNRTKGEFFKEYLCSADELATNCGPTTETACIEGKDEVYFRDSCGNPANVYDANKIYSKNPGYWQRIVPKSESCNVNSNNGNAGSATCGNCNYLLGSICKKGKATYGDFACKDINCYNTKNGKDYKNGESWCNYQGEVGDGQDTVGSRHFRDICINGEEIVEACADFRNEICIEKELSTSNGNFIESACRVNRWNDCIDQIDKESCENIDRRECYWTTGYYYDGSSSKTSKDNNIRPEVAETDTKKDNFGIIKISKEKEEKRGFLGLFGKKDKSKNLEDRGGICLPKYPPGLEFWNEGNAKTICSLGNSKQTIHFKEGFFGKKECTKNCEVLTKKWADDLNKVCTSLGDCGNFINIAGKFTDDGVIIKDSGKIRKISQGVAESAEPEKKGFFK